MPFSRFLFLLCMVIAAAGLTIWIAFTLSGFEASSGSVYWLFIPVVIAIIVRAFGNMHDDKNAG